MRVSSSAAGSVRGPHTRQISVHAVDRHKFEVRRNMDAAIRLSTLGRFALSLLATQTLESIGSTARATFGDLHAITQDDVAASNWATWTECLPFILIRAGTARGAASQNSHSVWK